MPETLAKLLRARQATAVKSPFDIAREHGFRGTVAEWLNSLRGERGLQGFPGSVGKDGSQGPQGPRGPQGPQGDIGPMPKHEWRGTELRFQQGPNGETWGPYVDIKGAGTVQQGYGVAVINQNANSFFPSGW